jgi:hypothetical protein
MDHGLGRLKEIGLVSGLWETRTLIDLMESTICYLFDYNQMINKMQRNLMRNENPKIQNLVSRNGIG